METQRFTRNPVEVEAVQVTPTNVAEVAKWCKGTHIETDYWLMGRTHKLGAIQLAKQGPKSDKTMTVLIGSWITRHKNIFKAWKHESFEQVYTPVGGGFAKGDLVRATNESPFNGWEGKVADPHLVGVDFGSRGKVVFEPGWLGKIDEMDSLQLELNAGVEFEQSGDPVKSVLDEMRAASREKIEAMERENLAYDDVIRVGDLVKIVKHPQVTQLSPYDGQCGHVSEIDENAPSADGPKPQYMVAFAKALDEDEFAPFEREELEKLRQDGEALNLAEQDENDLSGWVSSDLDRLNDEKQYDFRHGTPAEQEEAWAELDKIASDRPWEGIEGAKPHEPNQRVRIHAERSPYNEMTGRVSSIDNPNNYIVAIEGVDDGVGMLRFTWDELKPLDACEMATVSLNDLREDLGMARVPELEGVAPDERALENYRIIKESLAGMTPEEVEKVKAEVVQLQKVIGRTLGAAHSETMEVEETAVRISKEQDVSYLEGLHMVLNGEQPQAIDLDAKPLEVGDLIETLVVHDFDGVTIPVGTNGRVVTFDVEVNTNHVDNVEIMFADGHYHSFDTRDIKKV